MPLTSQDINTYRFLSFLHPSYSLFYEEENLKETTKDSEAKNKLLLIFGRTR